MTEQVPPSSAQPRVIRVFVSSTFSDMQAEREELIKRIFPQLRKLCEQRGVTWREVDLRWGITDEQTAEGKVLPICLDEISRCRPYFIGFLGERYGWVPDEIPPELIELEPWLVEHLDHSITELEILHAVLNNPEMADHGYFYFRDPAYLDALPVELRGAYREGPTQEDVERFGPEEAERRAKERRQKLLALKKRILDSDFPVEVNFRDPIELGELVGRDMTAVIDRLYPEGSEPSLLEQESFENETFATNQAEVYIERQVYFDHLNAHMQEDLPPLIVLGESGSGKSALLANWGLRYRETHPEDLVIMHFIGASVFSADLDSMLFRVMSELKQHFDIPFEIPEEAGAIKAEFSNWLHMAAARGRVILILDALDQLEDRHGAPDLLWLPLQVPPSVRIVLSTLPGRPLEALKTRNWSTLRVEPLKPDECKRLVVEYLARYSKALSSERVKRIVAASHTANPLYVRTLLEELRMFGEHYELDRRIDHYLAATTIPALYTKILERYESDYERDRPGLVRDAMSLLWAARRGLSEAELMDLLGRDGEPLPGNYWSPLYLAADQSLISRSGMIGFSHEYLRQAICDRYVQSEQEQRNVHLILAEYFENREVGDRMVDEMLWQFRQAGELECLAKKLRDIQLVKAAMKRNRYELYDHFRTVEAGTNLDRSALLSPVIESPADHLEYVEVVCLLLANGGMHSIALDVLKAAQEHCQQTGQRSRLAEFLGGEFRVRKDAIRVDPEGKLAKTPTRVLEKKIALQRDLGLTEAVVSSLEDLSSIELSRKEIPRALNLLREAERVARDAGHSYDRLRLLSRQSAVYWNQGDVLAALHLHSIAFAKALEENNRDALSDLCLQAGAYALGLGDDRADQYFANSVRFLNEVGNLNDAASRLQTVGTFYLRLGDGKDHARQARRLQEEARRLYSVLGSTKGTISPFKLKMLEMLQPEDSPDEDSEPSSMGFSAVRTVWPMSPLAPRKGNPGKRCTWWMVSPLTIDACKRSERSCFDVLGRGENVLERLDVEYTWDAILYLLSGFRRTPHRQRPPVPDGKDVLFHIATLGNWELNDSFDLGNGVYQYLTPDETDAIRQGFSHASRHPDQFATIYDASDMDLLSVYPGGWEEMGESGREYVFQQYDKLLAFFTRASKREVCVICGIWGPECETAVRRDPRKENNSADGISHKLQRARFGEQTRSSHGRKTPRWFRTTGGGGGTIDIECNRCGHSTFFEPRHGEVPPDRCPVCGAE